jgi:hypothetical protein
MIASAAVTDTHCTGIEFTVTDIDALAKAIACILVQEFELATALLAGCTLGLCGNGHHRFASFSSLGLGTRQFDRSFCR